MAVACTVLRVCKIPLTHKARRWQGVEGNFYLAVGFLFSNLDFWVELIPLWEQKVLGAMVQLYIIDNLKNLPQAKTGFNISFL